MPPHQNFSSGYRNHNSSCPTSREIRSSIGNVRKTKEKHKNVTYNYKKLLFVTNAILFCTKFDVSMPTSTFPPIHIISVCTKGNYHMPRKKNTQFAFRTSEQDAIAIRKKIIDSGKSQQDYLTNAALNAEIINPACFRELLIEYKRQGNNLNQLTRYLNTNNHADPYTAKLMENMDEERIVLWQLLNRCIQAQASIRQ